MELSRYEIILLNSLNSPPKFMNFGGGNKWRIDIFEFDQMSIVYFLLCFDPPKFRNFGGDFQGQIDNFEIYEISNIQDLLCFDPPKFRNYEGDIIKFLWIFRILLLHSVSGQFSFLSILHWFYVQSFWILGPFKSTTCSNFGVHTLPFCCRFIQSLAMSLNNFMIEYWSNLFQICFILYSIYLINKSSAFLVLLCVISSFSILSRILFILRSQFHVFIPQSMRSNNYFRLSLFIFSLPFLLLSWSRVSVFWTLSISTFQHFVKFHRNIAFKIHWS